MKYLDGLQIYYKYGLTLIKEGKFIDYEICSLLLLFVQVLILISLKV